MIVQDFLLLPIPLLALGLLGGSLWLLSRQLEIAPELLRKGMHVGTGLICLILPWIFQTIWPVLGLTLLILLPLWGLRHLPVGEGRLASVLHGVARRSAGELYFPLAIATLFVLAHDEPLYYVIPVLVLTLADATAALVGLRYGLSRYRGEDGYKSAEGSVSVFIVSFLATHVPLLLFSDMGRLEVLLVATLIGLLVSMLEAVAWRGIDNLFIPLGTWALLMSYRDASALAMLEVLLVSLALLIMVLIWRRRTTLTHSSLLASVLVGYAAWAIGGLLWLLPPLLVFLSYTGLARLGHERLDHDARAVGATVAAGLLCLIGEILFPHMSFYVAYITAFAAQLAIIGIARMHFGQPERSPLRIWLLATLQGWGVIILPMALLGSDWPQTAVYLAGGLLLVGLAARLFQGLQPQIEDCPVDDARWWRQAIIGGLPAAMAGLLMSTGAPWIQ